MERYTDPKGKGYLFDLFKPKLPTFINYQNDIVRVTSNKAVVDFAHSKSNVSYLETYDLFCDSSHCYNADLNSGIFYYSDTGHLSRYGAKLVWDNIGDQVYDFILRNNPDVKSLPPQEEKIDFLESH